jgi:hypothetical protein
MCMCKDLQYDEINDLPAIGALCAMDALEGTCKSIRILEGC